MAFERQNCDKKLSKNWLLTHFCYFFALQCFKNVSWFDQKCVKNVAKSLFCHIFVRFCFRMFPQSVSFHAQKCDKNVSKLQFLLDFCDIFEISFDRIEIHFWVWQIFATFYDIFCQLFVTFWFLTVFCQIFDSFLSHFCILSHFWQFFVTFLSYLGNGGTSIK